VVVPTCHGALIGLTCAGLTRFAKPFIVFTAWP
jgi:hypothetical protein